MTAVLYNPTIVQSLTDTPPVSAAGGDAFLIVATAKGSWAGKENQVAQWSGADWRYFTPATGDSVQQKSSGAFLFFDGTNWVSQAKWVGQEEGGALPLAGGTMTGAITTNVSSTGAPSANIFTQKNLAEPGPLFYRHMGGGVVAGTFANTMVEGWNIGLTGGPVDSNYGTVFAYYVGNANEGVANADCTEYGIVFDKKTGDEQIRALFMRHESTSGLTSGYWNCDSILFQDPYNGHTIGQWQGADGGSPGFKIGIPLYLANIAPTTGTSPPFLIQSDNANVLIQVPNTGAGVAAFNVSGVAIAYYANVGGAASHLFRTGVTMGGNGDKSASVANLTLTPEASQTAPVLAVTSGAGTMIDSIAYGLTAAITASTTQTQGQGPLKSQVNVIATVANNNDTCTLPTLSAALIGIECLVINQGANTLKLYPASGQNLGAGADTSTTIAAGAFKRFQSLSETLWKDAS